MSLNFIDKIDQVSENFVSLENMCGLDLCMPFTNTCSGSRKLMHGIHFQHTFPLLHAEKAIIETGYEIRYGDYSSSISKADRDYQVIAKISKFSFAPNHHYWLILKDAHSNYLDIQERISYEHITESYGYLYNNEYMDTLSVGDYIPNGTVVQKSLSYDEYNNKTNGRNFNVIYMSLDDNMEDSLIFSDAAASKLTSPLIKPVQVMINDNDIPLNLYGDDKVYKAFPDIGEDIRDANLIALRKEKKEEAYYTQSVDRLRNIILSDEVKQVHGKVIDVDIYCNNPDILDTHYYAQFKLYYNELQRMSSEIVKFLIQYSSQGYEMSYELQKFFANAKRVCNKDQYIDKRTFSNIVINLTVLEELPMHAGDKASNRYGGKGVCSDIWPQECMPRYKNAKGEYEYADIIFNSSTMYGRENPGQIFELSLTHIGCEIINKIIADKLSLDQAYIMIYKYMSLCAPEEAAFLEEMKSKMTKDDLAFYINSIIDDGCIHLSIKPMSESMTIDRLAKIYKEFPFVKQNDIEVAIIDSEGRLRHIKARRRAVIGKEYIYRLKQFAEEKFSATSLSSTNIKNENTKSKNKKEFKTLYSNTPIRFGSMETNNMNHCGAEHVIANLMIHSISPQGRRLVEQMYTEDPFSIDIKLNSDSKNRSAEIANTYLKTIGRRITFKKVKKAKVKLSYCPITFTKDPNRKIKPIKFISQEDIDKGYDFEKEFWKHQEEKRLKEERCKSPIRFSARNIKKEE